MSLPTWRTSEAPVVEGLEGMYQEFLVADASVIEGRVCRYIQCSRSVH